MLIVRTFWVWHKSEEGPDCEAAWSQWSVDANPEGWEAVKQKVLDSYGDGLDSHREIEVRLSEDAVLKAWWPDPIEGEVA